MLLFTVTAKALLFPNPFLIPIFKDTSAVCFLTERELSSFPH